MLFYYCPFYWTCSKNTAAIKRYIENQLKEDRESDQLSRFDPRTRLRVASNPTRGWQANKKAHLCAVCNIRAMPETEKPPAMRVNIYLCQQWCFNIAPGSTDATAVNGLSPLSRPVGFRIELLVSEISVVHLKRLQMVTK